MEKLEGSHEVDRLQRAIEEKLIHLGERSPYNADADEPDARYLAYGVRAPEMKHVISGFKTDFANLNTEEKIHLAKRLIFSGYGEQKSVALALLEKTSDYFSPKRFDLLEELVSGLHGWSKIDSYTGTFLRQILVTHENEFIELLKSWNTSNDLWLRRASVVIFTRKVAKSGQYKDVALANCNSLKSDPEHLVQTGVGWCLRDLMRWHKEEILEYVINLRKEGISSKITLYALRDIKGAERTAVLKEGSRS